jgi:acetyl esterase/lipase
VVPEHHAYGVARAQFGELFRPPGLRDPAPVAVVIHGGFWRARFGRKLMRALCEDLAHRGWAAWNLEYRRLGDGGGWSATFDDVAAGTRAAPRAERLVTIGHSAGGHLALWAAAQDLGVTHAVSQAGVADLAEAMRLKLSRNAARELLGEDPDGERLRRASPAELLPLGVPQLLVHGTRDDTVPVAISESYAMRARERGDEVQTAIVPCGHFEHLDPHSEAWGAVRQWIGGL